VISLLLAVARVDRTHGYLTRDRYISYAWDVPRLHVGDDRRALVRLNGKADYVRTLSTSIEAYLLDA